MGGRQHGIELVLIVAGLLPGSFASAATLSEPLARIGLEERYDQDLATDGGGASTLLQPSFGWRLRNPTTELTARYGADVFTFGGYGGARTEANHRLFADEDFNLGPRTVLTLHQSGERVFDPTSLVRPGVPRTAGDVTYVLGEAELRQAFTDRLHGSLGYRVERGWFDEEAAVNGTVHAPRATVSRSLSQRDEAGVSYRLQLFDADGLPSSSSHEPALTFAHRFDTLTGVTVEAGPAIASTAEGQLVAGRGRAEVGHRRERLTLNLSVERNLIGAAGLPDAVWSDLGLAGARWRVTSALTLIGGFAIYRNTEPQGGAELATGAATEARVTYAFGNGFAGSAAFRNVTQADRSGLGTDLSRNIFAAGVGWELDPAAPPR